MDAANYKKHTHREHILELPDTYVGSTDTHAEHRWVFDKETGKMAHREVAFNPGFYKLFDEIVVNARDALIRQDVHLSSTLTSLWPKALSSSRWRMTVTAFL